MGKSGSIKEMIKMKESDNRLLHFIMQKCRHIKNRISMSVYDSKLRKMSRRETFQYIYKNDKWGSEKSVDAPCDFYSGSGSHAVELVDPYVSLVRKLIVEKKIRSIVDLGCGDFNIGSRISPFVTDYTGCDIVPELIERNRKRFGGAGCEFVCLDIVDDELPAADLCLIREVFMHLSNEEVMQVLKKLRQYRYVLITETVVKSKEGRNEDITHGRYRGVSLNYPPFCITGTEMLRLKHPVAADSYVVSTLYTW